MSVRNLIEFVATSVLICASIFVLRQEKDEQQPKVALYRWIISYTCASIATLPSLCWRFCSQEFDLEGMDKVMEILKMLIDFFLVVWVTAFVCYLLDNITSLDYTTFHIWLCLAFLAFSFILHVLPNCWFALCCFYPMMIVHNIPLVLQVLKSIVGPYILTTQFLNEALEWISNVIESILDEL